MSEPMRGSPDNLVLFGSEVMGLPGLETVSEEIRLKADVASNGVLGDYYFRESFENSSSENGFTTLTETRIGHITKTGNGSERVDNGGFFKTFSRQNAAPIDRNSLLEDANNVAVDVRRFPLLHIFVPSFIFVSLLLLLSTIFIIESPSDMFLALKSWPEMLSFRYQYYEPIKEFVLKRVKLF